MKYTRIKILRILGLLALLFVVSFESICLADHLPTELQASGKPEKRLGGILLGHTKVSDVIKMYGKPSKIEKQAEPPDANWVDTYDYYWVKPGIKLHLVVYRGKELIGGEQIALIEVEGTHSNGLIGRTGKGLRLGDTLSDLKRIYGKRFKERNIPKLKIHDVMVQWRSEEYSLVAEFDRKGKIKNLSLLSPE